MTAMNIVHMRVKPGKEAEFLALNRRPGLEDELKGLRHLRIVRTGERSYCIVGEWTDMAALVAARPAMIRQLDRERDLLEDLGGGRGVTEPWSGDVVVETGPASVILTG